MTVGFFVPNKVGTRINTDGMDRVSKILKPISVLKMSCLRLKMTFSSLKMTFSSLKMTFLTLKMTFLTLKMTFLTLNMSDLSLNLMFLRPLKYVISMNIRILAHVPILGV
jgi:hypothetical protein